MHSRQSRNNTPAPWRGFFHGVGQGPGQGPTPFPYPRRSGASPGVPGSSLSLRGYGVPPGVPSLEFFLGIAFPSDSRSEKLLGGQPRATASRCGSPGNELGRRRAIGVVAVLQLSAARPRRWCDAGPPEADQKAGDEGTSDSGSDQRTDGASCLFLVALPGPHREELNDLPCEQPKPLP